MDTSTHTMSTLFDQLGLPSGDDDIAAFIKANSPLPKHLPLSEASFWSASQRAFLAEAIVDDAEWAEIVDQLGAALRE